MDMPISSVLKGLSYCFGCLKVIGFDSIVAVDTMK